jgi:Tol biopolymer transport system component
MKRFFAVSITLLALASLLIAQDRRFTIDDLLKVRRVSDPQVSPDGRQVAFTIGDVKFDDNRIVNQIYTVSLSGGEPKALTSGAISSSSPRWSQDGN